MKNSSILVSEKLKFQLIKIMIRGENKKRKQRREIKQRKKNEEKGKKIKNREEE